MSESRANQPLAHHMVNHRQIIHPQCSICMENPDQSFVLPIVLAIKKQIARTCKGIVKPVLPNPEKIYCHIKQNIGQP
jgi:hypothetical protein